MGNSSLGPSRADRQRELEQATADVHDEQLRTPELVAFSISRLTSSITDAVEVRDIEDMQSQDFNTLLAVAFGGSNKQALPALFELRERIKALNHDIAVDEAKRRVAEEQARFAQAITDLVAEDAL